MDTPILVCFPHAGADASAYRRWAGALARQDDGLGSLSVEIVNLPGRGQRYKEPLLTRIERLVDDAAEQIAPWTTGARYALFGHSMGAWLAYLTAQRLRGRGAPFRLIVSGARPPRLGIRKVLHHLPQDDFIAELASMGGFPQALLADPEALDYFLPILRADLEALATYQHRADPALDVPISVFRGVQDTVSREDALAWREESSRPVKLHEFDGSHFFVFEQAADVARTARHVLLNPGFI